MQLAKDIMNRRVIRLSPETTVKRRRPCSCAAGSRARSSMRAAARSA